MHNWSIGRCTWHIEVKQNFLQELKEAGIVDFEGISTYENNADMFTKNLGGPEFNKHAEKLCGTDEYYRKKGDGENSERGRVSSTTQCTHKCSTGVKNPSGNKKGCVPE